MEFPDLGKHCSEPECNRLDFLSFECACKKTFCAKHRMEHSIKCAELTQSRVKYHSYGSITCSESKCDYTNIDLIFCDKCEKHFCIRHRHINECVKEDPAIKAAALAKQQLSVDQFNEAKSNVDKQIDNAINNVKKSNKNAAMACKLQLMRIKNKATGLKSIPTEDRVYFNVKLPNDSVSPVFVSKTWSVGRAIDAIATEFKLNNNNNQSNAKKLRLFKQDNGSAICESVNDYLVDLLNISKIIDGESLIIAYVDDDCVHL